MKFFRVFPSAEHEEVGFVPQVHNAIVDFNIYDKNSAYHLNFSQANESTMWPISRLSGKAKKTDLVSISFMSLSNKLFVSRNMYSFLSNSNTEGIQFIKSKLVVRKGREEEYWIINPYLSDYSVIDVENCEFVFTDAMLKIEFEQVKFDSTASFIKAYLQNQKDATIIGYPNHRPLVIKKIAFKTDCGIDFFSVCPLSYGGIGYFVSERLKNEIEGANCTGIVFTEPNERYP